MSPQTRRTFLQRAAKASAVFSTFAISGTKASGRILGANDTVRIGVAGIHGRGRNHIEEFAGMKDVQVVYLVDPDSSLFASRTSQVKSLGGNEPVCVQDVRHALEDKNLDAISIATCNHWHSLMTIWACQAGKDVYVEKPLSHNVFEGRKCVEAARKYDRVVQHGTQQRSNLERARQIAAIQSGKYGTLLVSKGFCCKPRWSIGFKPTEAAPADLDFNLWLGPAPEQPFHRNFVHYNWHWFWDTGNGDTGNQGVHEMDVARWAIKGAMLPRRVWSLGGRYAPGEKDLQDQGQTPNMQLSVYDFGETLLVFETRGLVGNESGFAPKVSNEFYTSEGIIKDWKFHPKNGGTAEPIEGLDAHVTPGGAFGSFISAIRSRKSEDNNADVLEGHYSSALCHLGNISYRLGQPVPMQQKALSMGDNRQAVESLIEIGENLKAVGVPMAEATYQLGRTLELDPNAEKFVGDPQADQFLGRHYREPFVVPESV
jgi:predicted dehydrogenase